MAGRGALDPNGDPMTTATLIALASAEAEHTGNVALETVGYGVVAVVAFALLALVTLSYRHVANRPAPKAEASPRPHPAPPPARHGPSAPLRSGERPPRNGVLGRTVRQTVVSGKRV